MKMKISVLGILFLSLFFNGFTPLNDAMAVQVNMQVSGTLTPPVGSSAEEYEIAIEGSASTSATISGTRITPDVLGNFNENIEIWRGSLEESFRIQVFAKSAPNTKIFSIVNGVSGDNHYLASLTGLNITFPTVENITFSLSGLTGTGLAANPTAYHVYVTHKPCGVGRGYSNYTVDFNTAGQALASAYKGSCYSYRLQYNSSSRPSVVNGETSLIHRLQAGQRNISIQLATPDIKITGKLEGVSGNLSSYSASLQWKELGDDNYYSYYYSNIEHLDAAGSFSIDWYSGIKYPFLRIRSPKVAWFVTSLNGERSYLHQLTSFQDVKLTPSTPFQISGKLSGTAFDVGAYIISMKTVLPRADGGWRSSEEDNGRFKFKLDGTFSFDVFLHEYYAVAVMGVDPTSDSTSAKELPSVLGGEKAYWHIISPGSHDLALTLLPSAAGALQESEQIPAFSPTIMGTAMVGATLSVTGFPPGYTPISYQWYANGAAIPGATRATFNLATAQSGKKITVQVGVSKNGHYVGYGTGTFPGNVGGENTKIVPAYTATVNSLALGKTAKVATLPKGWTGKYQWYRSGKTIKGATKTSYKPVKADYGKKVYVKVTLTKSGITTVAASRQLYVGQPATVSVKLPKTVKAATGAKITVNVKVPKLTKPLRLKTVAKPTGKITISYTQGSVTKTFKAVTLNTKAKGNLTIQLPKLAKGNYKLSVSYSGTAKIAAAAKAIILMVK